MEKNILNNMLEKIIYFFAIACSCIALGTKIYKKLFTNSIKREKEYYKKVLIPYIDAYKSGNKRALESTIIQIKRTDEDIPKYIFHLIDQLQITGNNEIYNTKLHKVFVYDYLDIYPNDDNLMTRLADTGIKLVTYVMYVLAFIFLVTACIYFSNFVSCFILGDVNNDINLFKISNTNVDDILSGVIYLILYLVAVGAAIFFNFDRYTADKKKIKKIIDRKIKLYDKKIENYVY